MTFALALLLAQGITMNLSAPGQTIDGFGCAPGNAEQISMSTTQADQLFSQGKGIGLTIARARIGSYGPAQGYFGSAGTLGDSATSLQNYKLAQARGATIFAVNLSCPASMKSGGSTIQGNLNSSSYVACAAYYVSSIQDATQVGVNITGIEWQNEPNAVVSYESTLFTPTQLVAFIDAAGSTLRTAFPSLILIAPSSEDWQNTWAGTNYVGPILADGTAPGFVDYIGIHTYGSPDVSSAPGSTGGKRNWITEMSGLAGPGDASMTNAMTTAGWLYDALGLGQASAWIWWQFQSSAAGNDNQGLYLGDGTITKRLFVLGNYSKFVRPGMILYGFTGSAPAGVNVLMFKDPTSNNIAIVATNTNGTNTSLTVTLDSTSKVQAITPWVTDSTRSLVAQSLVAVSTAHSFTFSLPATSVTTFNAPGT